MLAALSYNRHMDMTIEVRGLRKSFGPTLALDGMTFTVAPGQVTGFVGPNGAGKTTTMRVILGLDAPDGGTALVGGRRYASLHRPLRQVGSLLDAAALQPSRTARNHLLWLAHSQGLGTSRVDAVRLGCSAPASSREPTWRSGRCRLAYRRPPTRAVPSSGASRPRITRIVVVCPAPLGPMNPVTCPGATVNVMPSSASAGPKRLHSPRTSIVMSMCRL